MIDVEQTIISQYGTSATIRQLIDGMNAHIDPAADIEAFYDYVWNVETAQGFGLDVWGRIVNISRELRLLDDDSNFGFNEQEEAEPFDDGTFYVGESTSSVFKLADDAYRKLILVKALANISATNAPSLNRLLQNLFDGRGVCYVNNLGNMQFRYTFEFDLLPYEWAIITQSGALPTPAGVKAYALQVPESCFGFSEQEDSEPFDQGTFIEEDALNAIS